TTCLVSAAGGRLACWRRRTGNNGNRRWRAMHIGIVGGGVAGLGCAYFLAQRGHAVEVFEQTPALGGLAGCFDFDGMQVEKYYHFVCRDDADLIDMLAVLGLSD